MLMTFAVHVNLTVIRELLLLTVVATAVRAMSAGDMGLTRAFIYITAVAFLPAFIAVTLFYAHWLDWPTWAAEHLNLSETNPLLTRAGDFDFYVPLWVAVIPHAVAIDQGFGLNFVRQTFVYIEPTDVWYFVSGPFWIALADTKMPARTMCLTVMGIALALSFSVFGILVTAIAIMLAAAMMLGGRALVAGICITMLVALPFVPLYEWVQLLGSNKADEVRFYAENVTVLRDVTLLGHPALQVEQPLSYGFLTVIYRYGIVGFGVTVGVALAILWAGFRLLGDKVLGWRQYPLFIACFVSVAQLVKGTTVVPTMAALSLAMAIGIRQGRLGPFNRR
jgi:hypothetical protein